MRADLFNKSSLFCVSFDGSEFSTINTSSISVSSVAHSFTLMNVKVDWSTDAKLKLKVGVVSVTVKQHTEAGQSINAGQGCCVRSLDRRVSVHPMPLQTWMSGFCLSVSGNQAHGVQTVAGRWKASLLDPESLQQIYPGGNQGKGERTLRQ